MISSMNTAEKFAENDPQTLWQLIGPETGPKGNAMQELGCLERSMCHILLVAQVLPRLLCQGCVTTTGSPTLGNCQDRKE